MVASILRTFVFKFVIPFCETYFNLICDQLFPLCFLFILLFNLDAYDVPRDSLTKFRKFPETFLNIKDGVDISKLLLC